MRERPALRTTHEETDVNIVQHIHHRANSGKNSIYVIVNDTDLFVLLLQHASFGMQFVDVW